MVRERILVVKSRKTLSSKNSSSKFFFEKASYKSHVQAHKGQGDWEHSAQIYQERQFVADCTNCFLWR